MEVSEDLENLLKLFDYALSSDNPAVKKALKNLLLVVSIVEPQEDAGKPGPLNEIKLELQLLRAELARLKNDMNTGPYRGTTYPSYPPYPNTGISPWQTGLYPNTWTSSTSSAGSATIPTMPSSGTLGGISSTGAIGATGSSYSSNMMESYDIDSVIESNILRYVTDMINGDTARFSNKDIT